MKFAIVALVGLLVLGLGAQTAQAVSQAGGISLTFPVGSRYNALGEAGTALSTDITSMWWNPGGFAFAGDGGQQRGIHMMYSPLAAGLAEDVNLTWLGYGQQVEGWGMLGASLTYLNQGEQQQTDEAGNLGETFNSYQFALGVTYGAKITEALGVGIGAKYFRDELAPDSATQDQQSGSGATWAVDLGAHYRVTQDILTGVSITNIGPDITFVDDAQSDPMPLTLRIGGAYHAWRSPLSSVTLIADYLISLVSEDETTVLGVGAEWGYSNFLFLRFGYKSDPEGEIENFTAGGGVDLNKVLNRPLSFDYASVPQADDLDRVHRFSFSFNF